MNIKLVTQNNTGTYFNYVRTIGRRGVGKMRRNAYRGEGGYHTYV